MKALRLLIVSLVVMVIVSVAWRTAHTRNSRELKQAPAIPQPAGPRGMLPPSAPQLLTASPSVVPPLVTASTPASVPGPAAAPAVMEQKEQKEAVERLGPFTISGGNYTVVLHQQHLAATENGDPYSADGVVAMEIADAAGAVAYRRTYPLFADDESVSVWQISANLLQGTSGAGLLVRSRPGASSGFYGQIFGVVNGKVVPFSGPFPAFDSKTDASGEYHTVGALGPQADEIALTLGTGRFVIHVPLRIDWAQGKLSLAPQCPGAPSAAPALCEYQLVNPNSYLQPVKVVTFVRLYASPEEKSQRPERVLVRPASQIALLSYRAEMAMKQPNPAAPPAPGEFALKDMVQIASVPGSTEWLQVRIDGKVGWIHSDEDLTALGLPQPADDTDPP